MVMERPTRKPNRLPDYDYSQNGAYFVTICTQERKTILCDIVGDGSPVPKNAGTIVEEWIKKIPEKYSCIYVDHHVVMPNHIHLLLRIADGGTGNPSPTLGSVVGWFKYNATKEINAQSGTMGQRVFQRSYFEHVIRGQKDYLEIWEYIENNPLKWKLDRFYCE